MGRYIRNVHRKVAPIQNLVTLKQAMGQGLRGPAAKKRGRSVDNKLTFPGP